nr:hypothetical protein CFP56_74496 [Quercus suber]
MMLLGAVASSSEARRRRLGTCSCRCEGGGEVVVERGSMRKMRVGCFFLACGGNSGGGEETKTGVGVAGKRAVENVTVIGSGSLGQPARIGCDCKGFRSSFARWEFVDNCAERLLYSTLSRARLGESPSSRLNNNNVTSLGVPRQSRVSAVKQTTSKDERMAAIAAEPV